LRHGHLCARCRFEGWKVGGNGHKLGISLCGIDGLNPLIEFGEIQSSLVEGCAEALGDPLPILIRGPQLRLLHFLLLAR
jgi:hypothetical protein